MGEETGCKSGEKGGGNREAVAVKVKINKKAGTAPTGQQNKRRSFSVGELFFTILLLREAGAVECSR